MKTSQVFVSHTSDMALFPEHRPFVQAVFDAVGRVGMAPVDMRYFPALFHALSELASGFSSAQPTLSSGRWRPEAGLRLQELAVSGRSASPHGHPGTATRFHETVPRVWNVPSKNADFTGRDAILDRLHGDLAGDRKAVVTERDTGWAVSARARWRSSTRTASKMTTTWSGGSPQSSLKRSAWPWPIWPPSCVPGEDRRRLPGTAARIGWISGAEEHVVEPAR